MDTVYLIASATTRILFAIFFLTLLFELFLTLDHFFLVELANVHDFEVLPLEGQHHVDGVDLYLLDFFFNTFLLQLLHDLALFV